jgi:hypothetical protein
MNVERSSSASTCRESGGAWIHWARESAEVAESAGRSAEKSREVRWSSMGTLRANKFELTVPDDTLLHLDVALSVLGSRGNIPRIHSISPDDRVHSFSGASVILSYDNSPLLEIDSDLMAEVLATAERGSFLVIPFRSPPVRGGAPD